MEWIDRIVLELTKRIFISNYSSSTEFQHELTAAEATSAHAVMGDLQRGLAPF